MITLATLLVLPLWAAAQEANSPSLTASSNAPGQVLLADGGQPILQYNARRVELPDGYWEKLSEANRIYAKPRSGYLHPLYGLDGEELTLDWSEDHPHHRGIYWAWPEVQFGERTADLHALQGVYSRPVGEPLLTNGDGFARVEAKNLWLWEDEAPVVFERVVITAHALDADGTRTIDLDLRFEALAGGVSLARRGTNLYGGLNTRLAPVEGLKFGHRPGPTASGVSDVVAEPLEGHATQTFGWSTTTGTWKNGKRRTTLAILEHPTNPDFPADFITYEYLPWFQPTFPRADTRFALEPGRPLVLNYRFVILAGEAEVKALDAACERFAKDKNISPRPDSDD